MQHQNILQEYNLYLPLHAKDLMVFVSDEITSFVALNLSRDLEFNFIPGKRNILWYVEFGIEFNGLIAPTPSVQQVVVNRHNNTAFVLIAPGAQILYAWSGCEDYNEFFASYWHWVTPTTEAAMEEKSSMQYVGVDSLNPLLALWKLIHCHHRQRRAKPRMFGLQWGSSRCRWQSLLIIASWDEGIRLLMEWDRIIEPFGDWKYSTAKALVL